MAALKPSMHVLLLLAAGFAGVTGAGCFATEGDDLLTAFEAVDIALDHGEEEGWDADAELREAVAVEAGPAGRERIAANMPPWGDEDPRPWITADALVSATGDLPGDGKAPVWHLTFVASSAAYEVQIVAGQGVVYEIAWGGPNGKGEFAKEEIGAMNLDSDEVLLSARAADPTFGAAAQRRDAVLVHTLRQVDDRPTWLLSAVTPKETDEAGEEVAWAVVSAGDGQLLQLKKVATDFGLLRQESGESSQGYVGGIVARLTDSFFLEAEGHQAMVLVIRLDRTAGPASVRVTAPDGQYEEVPLAAGDDLTQAVTIDWPGPLPSGQYVIEADTTLSPATSVTTAWCTDGLPQVEESHAVCELLGEKDAAGATAEHLWQTLSRSFRSPIA